MIWISQFNGLMADLAEQLLNMEPVEDPGSNLFVEQPLRMSHLAASLKSMETASRSPWDQPWREDPSS